MNIEACNRDAVVLPLPCSTHRERSEGTTQFVAVALAGISGSERKPHNLQVLKLLSAASGDMAKWDMVNGARVDLGHSCPLCYASPRTVSARVRKPQMERSSLRVPCLAFSTIPAK